MDWLIDLLTNQFLLVSLSSWFVAQVLKTILYALETKKLDITRLFGDGGMPSQATLTKTEIKVMDLLGKGMSNKELAKELEKKEKALQCLIDLDNDLDDEIKLYMPKKREKNRKL